MASVRRLKPTDTKSPWIVEYTDGSGKRRRRTPKSGLKKDAEKLRLQIEQEIGEGGHTPDRESITVADACERYLDRCAQRYQDKERMARNTLHQRRCIVRKHIVPFLGAVKLSRLTAPAVQDWMDKIKRIPPKSTSLLHHCVGVLKEVVAEAQRKGLVARNVLVEAPPYIGIKSADPILFPSKDQVRGLLNACEKEHRSRVLISLAAFAGMRIGEILALTWDDIDFDKRTVNVSKNANKWKEVGPPKSRAGYREIPLAPNLVADLKAWRASLPPNDLNLVLPARGGNVQCQADWQSWGWPRVLRMAGLHSVGGERLRTHSLRHFAASLFIESGLPPKRIQYLMGHSSISITFDRYGHLFPDEGQTAKAIDAIEAAFRRDKNTTLAA